MESDRNTTTCSRNSFSNTAARNQTTVVTDLTTTNNLTLSTGGTVVGVVTKAGVPVVGAQVSLTSSNGTLGEPPRS